MSLRSKLKALQETNSELYIKARTEHCVNYYSECTYCDLTAYSALYIQVWSVRYTVTDDKIGSVVCAHRHL